jgi:DNA-binding CsgD family transcriptional regulator
VLEFMATRAVIGRDAELAAVGTFLAEVERGPTALVLSGEAGIGKTILWEAGLDEARERGASVLTCRGAEAEASLSFAGLSELLGDVLDEVEFSLTPPRRRALEVALAISDPGDSSLDPHAVGLAVLDVLRALAGRGPVLVALDDVQWLDSASAGSIQIAVRRLHEEPLGLLATLRLGPKPGGLPDLERSFPDERVERLTLGPLSLGALHRLLNDRLGLGLTRPELARVQEATVGNPFFALELGRELVRTNTRPAPGQPLRIPDTLRELLTDRLTRLPESTVEVLIHASALARPTLEVLSGVGGEDFVDGLDEAVREGVVELDGNRLRFAHPLLASIFYERAPPTKRRAVHRALAEAVEDAEERARHLALAISTPDAEVARELETAAEFAAARGATSTAAALAELAADRTPDDPALCRRRRFRAARFHYLAGDRERAVAILRDLLPEAESGFERADVLFALASTLHLPLAESIELCDEALIEAAADDARLVKILGFRAGVELVLGNVSGALKGARAALDRAERVADPTALAHAIARTGMAETYIAEVTPGMLERGADIERRLDLVLEHFDSPCFWLSRHLIRLGDTEQAREILGVLDSAASARGDEASRAMVRWTLCMLEWLAGRWSFAIEHAAVARELGEQTGYLLAHLWRGRVGALLEADMGLAQEARASAEESLNVARAQSNEAYELFIRGVLGRLELALGNLEAAGEQLRELPSRLLRLHATDPTLPVWGDAIEALVGLGERERALNYLVQFEVNARRLGSLLAVEAVSRSQALVAGADGNPAAGVTELERFVREVPAPGWPLERARTMLALGSLRRQANQKRAARDALERALTVFDALPAPLWAEKARAELRRISGRAPASEDLTETERRVAELAAQGRTNKEIAAELYMGLSTVESHLSHVYRKLGVRRAELAARLSAPQVVPAKAGEESVQT